ncbi:alpha/beta fold hydrolase [Nocardia fluminea]|uniref:alpha/beta fold hydrolase n=1 Tax=Nocardia fluminea TaxID=134984 RepID=UPI00366D45E8
MPEVRRVSPTAGVELWAEVTGQGSPHVLVPGAGGDHSTWDPMWPQLTATHHCMRYDLRGCGASADRTTAGFRHADDLAALLDGLGISRTALTGASMGGRIAVDFALSYPDRVDRLVLISPGLADWDWSDTWRAHWLELSRTARSGDLERTRDMWFHHPLFATARRDPAMAARLRATIAADACRVWVDADREIPPARPHIEALPDLTMPVLLITGADDVQDFRVIAEIITAMVPDVRRMDLPDTGHLAHLERPAETAAEIRSFLSCGTPVS